METRDETPKQRSPVGPSAARVTADDGPYDPALLDEFRQWLCWKDREIRLERTEPEATQEEDAPDLHSFYAALVGLREEVRRDSRQGRKAVEEGAERARRAEASMNSELQDLGELVRGRDAERQAVAERRELLELIALRDRAALAPIALAEARRRWGVRIKLAGLGSLCASLDQGQAMLLGRFDELLAARGVERIPCAGVAFDPSRMKAVEVDQTPGLPGGTVTDELRAGFTRNGAVLRLAEVRVARPDEEQ